LLWLGLVQEKLAWKWTVFGKQAFGKQPFGQVECGEKLAFLLEVLTTNAAESLDLVYFRSFL